MHRPCFNLQDKTPKLQEGITNEVPPRGAVTKISTYSGGSGGPSNNPGRSMYAPSITRTAHAHLALTLEHPVWVSTMHLRTCSHARCMCRRARRAFNCHLLYASQGYRAQNGALRDARMSSF